MSVLNQTELNNTRQKLLKLQALYAQAEPETGGDEEASVGMVDRIGLECADGSGKPFYRKVLTRW